MRGPETRFRTDHHYLLAACLCRKDPPGCTQPTLLPTLLVLSAAISFAVRSLRLGTVRVSASRQ